jgi:hypothetical protein
MPHAPDGTDGRSREAGRRLRNGLIPLAILLAMVVGLLLAVPGLDGVATVLRGTATSIRDTEHLLLRPDWRILGAIGYLWFDIAVLMACFAALGSTPPLASVILAYQIAYISNAIPVPGGIGILDGSLVGVLVLYGVPATPATAATLAYNAIALWFPAMWGTIAFLILRRSRRQPLELRPTREERRRIRASGADVLAQPLPGGVSSTG